MLMVEIDVLQPLLFTCSQMGRVTSKGNEAKSNMKHSSDMPTPNSGDSDLWSNPLPLVHGGAPNKTFWVDSFGTLVKKETF